MAKYDEWLTEEGLLLLAGYARDGMVDREIAETVGVSRTTLNKWRDKFPQIKEALKDGKEAADRKVENELFKRCTGQIIEFNEPIKLKKTEYDPKTGRKISEKEDVGYVKKQTYIPADVNAQKFWLTNRKPDKWKMNAGPADAGEEEETGTIEISGVRSDEK